MKAFKIYMSLGLLLMGFATSMAQTIGLSIPTLDGVRGQTITIPVNVDSSLTGLDVTSYQIQITFTSSYLSFTDVQVGGTLTENLGEYSYHQNSDNQITIAAAGSTPLAGTGVLLNLRFQMLRSGYTYLNFDGVDNNYFNEGDLALIFDNGRVNVSDPPVVTVSPNEDILTKGETLQFSVNGGTSPYSWNLTNPAIATIDASGLLTANAAGFTRVIAEDQVGTIDTCNGEIEIRAFQLSVPDIQVYQGHTIDVPVNCTSLTGLDISSGSFSLTYGQNHLEPQSITTSGSILDGYGTPQFYASDGKVNISFAGDTPLSGEGVLLNIRFLASLENHGGSYLNFQDILFDEIFTATNDNGYCTVLELLDLAISPSSGTLMVGETLQFEASGGELPYSWAVSDPALATIDANGLLTAVSGGTVIVNAQDAIGASGSSNEIEIYDTQVTIPDTVAQIGSSFDLPIFMAELPVGQEIFSFQVTVIVDTNVVKNLQAINVGTLAEGWSVADNMEGNAFTFALAGTSPITSGGTLVKLRLEIDPGVSDGHRSNLSFMEMTLNEGNPRALSMSGVLTSLITGIHKTKKPGLPTIHTLAQNYPNPFNPITRIDFELVSSGNIELNIYNIVGKNIFTLGKGFFSSGKHSIIWDGRDFQGRLVSSGVYFYQLKVGNDFQEIRKMILQK